MYGKFSKIPKPFSLYSHIVCWFFMAGMHQKCCQDSKEEDPNQTASSEAV